MKKEEDSTPRMHRRRITLSDGRYLIFYTFGEEGAPPADEKPEPARAEPDATPRAEEEESV